ncbi:uncharacterized HhH-GPD family protein [Ferrithrix thermotolerans DSM 19514]|uniref:Uncharacterized HhH-GPD family protein n=1 Tax=Ferrithrix thermotolerans DSM 19514 TaxID=1121881 RepID=A0A1M4V7T0_9ACTN|nr:HhH-GPD-type base excision DNA repair protein [Ferrithrix thermotolerans]SHE64947.1 uncharacterized HhH-GPD family protein [Ferrithrix thermotolerans DSM 19514]
MYLTTQESHNELLEMDPLALLIGMLLDQQIPMERAFSAPALLKERLGGDLDAAAIALMDVDALTEIFSQKPALHRFPRSMAKRCIALCEIIANNYGNDAAKVWRDATNGEDLVQRISALPGFGEQKAKIFAALLAKQFNVRPSGWREATAPFGEEGVHMSVADITSQETLRLVKEYKAQMKAQKH